MKLLLPSKHLTEQDKRALGLYFAIALLTAVFLAFVLFFASGKKTEMEHPSPATPKPLSRNQQ